VSSSLFQPGKTNNKQQQQQRQQHLQQEKAKAMRGSPRQPEDDQVAASVSAVQPLARSRPLGFAC
jgi:hypothetical protein